MSSPQASAVKSRLLPLTRREAVLERWIEALPRRQMPVRLKPAHQVEVADASCDGFRSTGTTPWFEVDIDLAACRGEWLYVEAALVRNNGSRVSWLHFDQNLDDAPTISWPIPTNLRGSVREVVRVPFQTTCIRWQPTCDVGHFSQSPLLVHRIGCIESVLRRWYRVALWNADAAMGISGSLRAWQLLASTWHLQRAYRASADFRLRHARGNDYAAFLARTERVTEADIHQIAKVIARGQQQPTFAMVTCLVAPQPAQLRAMVDSLRGQWYPHWELWFLGDTEVGGATGSLLQELLRADARIRIRSRDVGPGLIEGFGWAYRTTGAGYVAQIGQHDLVRPWTLHAVARELAVHPQADVIYGDHDRVNESGCRFAPTFTPEWNPDLLLSQNYVAGLLVFRSECVIAMRGYRTGFEGGEDFDLLLRLVRSAGALQVRRVARVLYSVRTHVGPISDWPDEPSTAERSRVCMAELRAIQDHVAQHGAIVTQVPNLPCYRVQYPLPAPAPCVTVIVPTRDKVSLLRACVEGLVHRTEYPSYELLVVDNGSVSADTLQYLDEIRRDPRVRVIDFAGPFNFSAMNNYAVRFARGSVLALVNNDVEVIHPEWLSEMVRHALRPGIGAVGAKLLYANGLIQHAGVILGIGGVAGHAHRFLGGDKPGYGFRAMSIQNVSAVTGACLVVRKDIYLEVGGLNEVDLAVAMNDVDFCLRLMEAGYRNLFTPFATLYHHESMSRGRDDTAQKQELFRSESGYMQRRWGKLLAQDPAYNPNLTLQHEDFSY